SRCARRYSAAVTCVPEAYSPLSLLWRALLTEPRVSLENPTSGRPDAALASVTRQGFWVLVGLVSVSGLGFAFWILAAHLFPTEAVGVAGSLASLSTFGAAFAVLGLDAGLVRFAPHALHPRRLIPSAGVVGLFAAYTIPLFPVMLTGFVLLPRTWPGENPTGKPQALRDIAGLSVGNWLSAFGYAIPYLCGPALVLYFFDATTAAFFFIALQLGEILNYGSDALTKSLFAHGSREDRLAGALKAGVRNRILLV